MADPQKPLVVGVPRETCPGETRVAVVPSHLPSLTKAGVQVVVESNAGAGANISDAQYEQQGARIAPSRAELFQASDVLLQVRAAGANFDHAAEDIAAMHAGQYVLGFCEPLLHPELQRSLAERGVNCLSLELLPRITRAQAMDALSSMATISGYKAALLAASAAPRMFPMLMTAAGTVAPAKVFVVGAGVAGLQAIATAHRLGAVVQAYDVRPAVKDEVTSVGGRFVELPLDTSAGAQPGGAGGQSGGYAQVMDEAFYRRQREMMLQVVGNSDVVITTAAVPGKPAPKLITAEMVAAMSPGSVIVDLAAERGGNCELTRPGETVVEGGVTILGPLNLPATIPVHASQMYSKNVTSLLLHLIREGRLQPDLEDPIVKETLVTRAGDVVHPVVRDRLGMKFTMTADVGDA